jgi:hypothetical protein
LGEEQFSLDGANSKSCEIVVADMIHPGHLCCLTTGERTTGLLAAFNDSLYDGCGNWDLEFAATIVIEKIKWFGPLNQEVVH